VVVDLIVVTAGGTSRVELAGDGRHDRLHLSQLLLQVLGSGRGAGLVDPVRGVLERGEDGLLVIRLELSTETERSCGIVKHTA